MRAPITPLIIGLLSLACTEEPSVVQCQDPCPPEGCADNGCRRTDMLMETDAADASSLDAEGADTSQLDAGPPWDAADSSGDVGLEMDAEQADATPRPGPVERERSLVWVAPEILEDPQAVSLARTMAAASDDGHGGRLFDWTLRRFGTTAFSVRPDQTTLADEMRMTLGADPGQWNLAAAPFIVTAVHLRIDLASPPKCGELRVSLSTTHTVVQPFHLIFLFSMHPEPGQADCYSLATRLARLSEMDEQTFYGKAKELLDEHLTPDRFIVMESAEFTFFPWEWRQWKREANVDPETMDALPFVLENPLLFQTVDVEGLNRGGPRRAAFLQWVSSNAGEINRRTILIPDEFRARHAIAPTAIPRTPLSLRGLNPEVLNRYPNLRKNLEIVGCPACHTADAEFVQTNPDRTFSDFYDKELDARAIFLDTWIRTNRRPPVPFGPLQANPELPD